MFYKLSVSIIGVCPTFCHIFHPVMSPSLGKSRPGRVVISIWTHVLHIFIQRETLPAYSNMLTQCEKMQVQSSMEALLN